ncbi:MAG: nitronate monooxygenase [Planctomycetota bacterium]|nr:MAG: nitronate monooxygenase [Planctomycetota bacterium]
MSARPPATPFTRHAGVEVPLLCGAMYPCSNPELVAAVSEAGGLGVVQPLSLAYVHGHDLRSGLRRIRELTDRPIGFNAIVERSSRRYLERMIAWVGLALEEGVRFFVTALGKPGRVVEMVHGAGGRVYHDVTARRWAEVARDEGVDGLICVNNRAGGHAGTLDAAALFAELADLGLPLVAAGGAGDERAFVELIRLGYAGVQMGTRFIATPECRVHPDYRQAIVAAAEDDIVLTDRLSGVPVSVIRTPLIDRLGPGLGPISRRLLRHPRTKHLMRALLALRSVRRLKRSALRGVGYRDVWQAGRSVAGIHEILPAAEVVRRCRQALAAADSAVPPSRKDGAI